MDDLSGKVIKGYEIQQLLGAGGFGAVYKAYQPQVKREVAIKVILPEFANQPEFVRRFETEAQLVAKLEHIHIVPLYDYWRDPSGAFIVMRWLRGGSMRNLLEKGQISPAETVRIIDQIAAALHTAHRNNVVHRDIKPDNILFDEDDNAYLADFGIAKVTDAAVQEEEEGLIGSPAYLSPEQIMTETLTPSSDIYSLGLVIYEMLTGRHPFAGEAASTIIMKHLQEMLPGVHITGLSAALDEVIQKATAKEPQMRYENVLALAVALRNALAISTGEFEKLPPEELARLGITEEFLAGDFQPVNPYKGLRAFQESDADDFFGREALANRLILRLKEQPRFLVVIGPSGSGKSSVLRAGVIPKLRDEVRMDQGNWLSAEMTPGNAPIKELIEALLRVAINPAANLEERLRADKNALTAAVNDLLPESTELVLLIDQFEELFTLTEDENERTHFLDLLMEASKSPQSRVRVVATLRADFYDRPLLYPEFGELVRTRTEVVLPMTGEEIERAIVMPAQNVGMGLEVGLVSAIASDVNEQPGALPLLQYALTELFERRDGRWMTLEAYKQIGGVSGALAQRADELYLKLDSAGQRAAKQMFLRLVTPGEGAEDTRRRARLDELLSLENPDVMQRVIDQFGKYRLLTFDRDPATRTPTIEVAHEALIRRWTLLRSWLSDSREILRLQRRVSTAAEEWKNARKDASFLASGSRLDQFEPLLTPAQGGVTLNALEVEYVRASLAEREKQRAEEAARAEKEVQMQRQARNRLRALVGVGFAAAIMGIILSIIATTQAQEARNNASTATYAQGEAVAQAQIAEENAATATFAQGEAVVQAQIAEENAAQSRSLSFASGAQLALNTDNTDLAILLALESVNIDQPSTLVQNTLAEVAYAPGTRRAFLGHTDSVISVVYNEDGTRALSSARDNTAILWDVATGDIIQRLTGHTDWLWDAAFSPDGISALTASRDRTLMLWDLRTGEVIRTFGAGAENTDLELGHTAAVSSVAFSPDGTQILSGSFDNTLILWDVETGEIIRRFSGHTDQVYDVAFSRTGFTALSGSADRSMILWNVETGQPLLTFRTDETTGIAGHTSIVWSVAYSPDETMAISASDDRTMILWSFETGLPVRRFAGVGGHSARITDVAFSPDGRRLLSSSEDNTVILWDVGNGQPLERYGGQSAPVYGVDFSANGQQFLSAGWDLTVRLWDINSGAEIRRFLREDGTNAHSANVHTAVYSPDETLIASGGDDGQIILWDTATGAEVRRMGDGAPAHNAPVMSIAFSPDGRQLLSGGDDLRMVLWDVATGTIIHDMNDGHSDGVMSVAFSPDGTQALSGSRDDTMILWDLTTGAQLQRYIGHRDLIEDIVFLPDGLRAISASWDSTMILWNLESGDQERVYQGHTDRVRSLALSADGTRVMSASFDGTLILWDVEQGERLRQYEGHGTQVISVDFNADETLAVSGSADTLIIVWDVATGAELRRYAGNDSFVRSVQFSSDGTRILSGAGDGSVREWLLQLDLTALIDWTTSNRYLREFTCAERSRYQVLPLCAEPTPVPDVDSNSA